MPVKTFKDFDRWSHLGLDGKLSMVNADGTPFITYRNGVPCYEANMYMLHQLEASRSRRGKGGSLRTYANQIIHLVKFIERQPNIEHFSQLTDSTFRLFVQGLQIERDKFGERVRQNNHVIEIAHRCLNFLIFVQDFHDLHNFIGIDKKNAIRVKVKKYSIAIEGRRKKKEGEAVSHSCVPTKDAVKRKLPVSEDDALKVWQFVQNQPNRDKRLRDIALYQCMEQLGGRITELHLITLDDVKKAIQSGNNPYITLTTLKRRDDKLSRSIPIPKTLIRDINQYIKVRKRMLKKLKVNDHGYLFISLTTGRPFQPGSWTTYLNSWKKALGIKGEMHPHLYRHAFITNKLKEIILHHKGITSADKFREHLLHTEKFKMQLQQWTGHTQLYSLDTYINLVFSDLNGYAKTYNAVALKDSVTIVKRQIASFKKQLKEKEITMTEGLLMIESILETFESDIDDALSCN
ncbi:TPA: site-specific integrase [Vibrio parahaemolyticus]|uniref:site-specific integrase n=1 Tax=Vibrio parahaemolyticus TaxID=670 RepID=UPI00235E6C8E|nr:site-specific integrase [Vibrio parahaemolyticus]HCG6603362.1 site-specific integrase [Vibrio parahaemolyticus]